MVKKINRTSPTISHLIYTDDMVIFTRANVKEETSIHTTLEKYCNWLGQRVSFNTSMAFFK